MTCALQVKLVWIKVCTYCHVETLVCGFNLLIAILVTKLHIYTCLHIQGLHNTKCCDLEPIFELAKILFYTRLKWGMHMYGTNNNHPLSVESSLPATLSLVVFDRNSKHRSVSPNWWHAVALGKHWCRIAPKVLHISNYSQWKRRRW